MFGNLLRPFKNEPLRRGSSPRHQWLETVSEVATVCVIRAGTPTGDIGLQADPSLMIGAVPFDTCCTAGMTGVRKGRSKLLIKCEVSMAEGQIGAGWGRCPPAFDDRQSTTRRGQGWVNRTSVPRPSSNSPPLQALVVSTNSPPDLKVLTRASPTSALVLSQRLANPCVSTSCPSR